MKNEQTRVYLSDKAFIGMVISAIEAFRKETLGAVFGFRTLNNEIIVEYAIPYQSAERKYVEVTANWRRESKILEILPKITHLDHVGYFHSHTEYRKIKPSVSLSEGDQESMYEGHIEFIIAIWKKRKSVEVGYDYTGKELSISIGNYNLKLATYFKNETGKILKCKIVCPYAAGLYEPVKE